jgi:type VI protein secretion system component VasF
MQLDHQMLESEQAQRLRRARRTAVVVGVIAFVVFAVSIVQMLWLQHHPQAHAQAVREALMQ